MILAEFDEFELREIEDGDFDRLEEWIAVDPYHASLFVPEFFLGRNDPRATCYALDDDKGTVFYIRLSRASRVHIQFPPMASQRRRIALGLMKGMAFLEVALSRAGVEEWIFASESPQLRHMAVSALEFNPSPNELVRLMARREVPYVRRP